MLHHPPKRSYRLFPTPLAKGLLHPMHAAYEKRGFVHEALMHYWPMAVGEALAPYATPVRLTQAKGKGENGGYSTLTVKVDSAYAALFAHETEAILQRLTRLLGYRPAERLVLVQ
jgi:hypothetical protein